MDEALQKRIAGNEAMLRDANEAIGRGLWPGDDHRTVRFRCECAQLDCNQAIELRVKDYEAVRAHPRRFVLVEGHERTAGEAVVQRRSGHVVVEKVGEAGVVAEEQDPRS
jgi:hypothetical protein